MIGPDETLRAAVDECVHCGFCLPACPTYVLWGEETDSPRGRIHLAAQVLAGAPLDGAVNLHFDRCLSCMACVTACPSGVRYDEIVHEVRGRIETEVKRPWRERLARSAIFSLFPRPGRLRVARSLLRVAEVTGVRSLTRRLANRGALPEIVGVIESITPATTPLEALPVRLPAVGPRRGTVVMLSGCVQRVFFSSANAATARVLAAEGYDVVIPPDQRCCGALAGHVGRDAEASRDARRLIDALDLPGVDAVVVNAAGCGSAMKEYGELLSADPQYANRARAFTEKVRDFAEFVAEVGARAERRRLEVTVAYHDACHLSHAQGIRAQPRELLRAIPGVELREIARADLCCGSAGVYNLLQPEAGRALGEEKGRDVYATGAEIVVAANPGCLMQIRSATERAGTPMPAFHIAEILDYSIRGVTPPALDRHRGTGRAR